MLLINKNMTALNLTDIPSNIDTLEKLGMWVGFALSEINLATSATEAPGYTQRVAQAGIFYVETDNRHRALIRLSIPVDKSYLSGKSNTWTYAQELTSDALTPEFKNTP